MPDLPVTDEQWRLFRDTMERIAEGNTRYGLRLNPVEVAEAMLILMDRIDALEKRIDKEGAA